MHTSKRRRGSPLSDHSSNYGSDDGNDHSSLERSTGTPEDNKRMLIEIAEQPEDHRRNNDTLSDESSPYPKRQGVRVNNSKKRHSKSVQPPDYIHLRILVLSKEGSAIIGTQASNITEIKRKCSISMNVSDFIPGVPDRVVHLRGSLERVAKAANLITRVIVGESLDHDSSRSVVGKSPPHSMRLLFPDPIIGAMVGRGGVRLKQIEEDSAATVRAESQVLSRSTDRIIEVSGVADAIHIAVYYLSARYVKEQEAILENEVLAYYDPAKAHTKEQLGRDLHRDAPASSLPSPPHQTVSEEECAFPSLYRAQTEAMKARDGVKFSQYIPIPDRVIGRLIGRAGQKLRHIRSTSNARISVKTEVDSDGNRVVKLYGTSKEILVAIFKIHRVLLACKYQVPETHESAMKSKPKSLADVIEMFDDGDFA